ncbi:hypothetical protein SESBI_00387 [Sesbania bispinosa]|nr:hypothetical protein SESBI_00387 [Sesbania bispinosa]
MRVSPFASWLCTMKSYIERPENVSVWVQIRRVENVKTGMVYHRGSQSIGGMSMQIMIVSGRDSTSFGAVVICRCTHLPNYSRGGSCKVMDDSSQSWKPDYTMLKEGESSIFYLEEDGEIHIENENGGAYFIDALCGGDDWVDEEGDKEEYRDEPSFEGVDSGRDGSSQVKDYKPGF